VSIPSVSFGHHLYLPKSPPPNLPAGDRVTVVVTHGRCNRRELEYVRTELATWQSLHDWGISVDHLEIDDSRYLSETEWSTTTFKGLRLLSFLDQRPFPSARAASSFEDFIRWHDTLCTIYFGSLRSMEHSIWDDEHNVSGLLQKCSSVPLWTVKEGTLSRLPGHSFDFRDVVIEFKDNFHCQRSLVSVGLMFPEIQSMDIRMGRRPTYLGEDAVVCGYKETVRKDPW